MSCNNYGRSSAFLALILLLGGFCLNCTGCSVVMAARAPGKVDLSVLTPGIERSRVVAELGPPIDSQGSATGSTDVFAFKQGYSTPTRFSRVVFHSAADFFTLGLWEVAGTPLEAVLQGEEVRTEVRYNQRGRVNRVEYFAGAHLANGQPTLAPWLRPKSTVQTAVIDAPHRSSPDTILPASATVEPVP